MVVEQVPRLGPGDLAPSLDFENAAVVTGNAEPTPAAWRVELESFLDTLEKAKLGRTPLVYTSGSAWGSHIQAAAAGPDFAHSAITLSGRSPTLDPGLLERLISTMRRIF